MKYAPSFLVAGLAVLFCVLGGTAGAEPEKPAYILRGFRSAHFGMSPAQVRAAIERDFPTAAARIQQGVIAEGRTPVLLVRVPALFPNSGAGEVGYLFGYRSNRLMQIAITFSSQTDPNLKPDRLVIDGKILQNYFLGLGYPAKQVVVNQVASIGAVLFQGIDPLGHATELVLAGRVDKSATGRTVLTPQMLRLSYIADPKHPDVMKSLAGQF